MTWRDDSYGIRRTSKEVKVFAFSGHTWGMKLSQLSRQVGVVRLTTYSLPRIDYVREQLGRRPHSIEIVCNTKFLDVAKQIKREFPAIGVAVHPEVHAKQLLIEPATVYIGSSNFGSSGWVEADIGIRDSEIHDWCVANFRKLWSESTVI